MELTPEQLAEYELRATMAERERCAKVAEREIAPNGNNSAATVIAQNIRTVACG